MKNLYKIFLIPFCCIMISGSCKDENNVNNPDFTCKVNGKKFNPNSNDFKRNATECLLSEDGTFLTIRGVNDDTGEHVGFRILAGETIKQGTYPLNTLQSHGYYYIGSDTPVFKQGNDGILVITKLDPGSSKISGTFYFKAFNERNQEVVNITEGVFNINYQRF